MDQYTIFKGKHAAQIYGMATPAPVIRRGVKNVAWTVCFDKNCAYTLPGADQRDWNKGGGLSFASALLSKEMLSNHVDSAMWGWRYNPLTGLIELTAYCHIDGKRPFLQQTMYSQHHAGVDGEVCLELKFGQKASSRHFVYKMSEVRADLSVWRDGELPDHGIRSRGSCSRKTQKS